MRVSDLDRMSGGLFTLSLGITLLFVLPQIVSASLEVTWDRSGTTAAPLGSALEVSGDFDGDGWVDLAVVVPDGECIEVFRGSPSGWLSLPTWVLRSPDETLDFGSSLCARGDFDGNGRSDLAVGAPAPFASQLSGAVWIYRDLDRAPLEIRSSGAGDRFGASLAWVDSDGDGRHELFVGSPTHTGPSNLCGRVDWYRPSGLASGVAPSRSFFGTLAGDGLGATVISAGDLDGDGDEELLLGAPDASRGQNREGLVLLYAGSATGPGLEPVWREQGDHGFGYFGYAATFAGDTDGNGAAEVLIGGWGIAQSRGEIRLFEWEDTDLAQPELVASLRGGQTLDFLGVSLAGAIDVDGDGRSDCGVGVSGADVGGPSSGEVLWMSRASDRFAQLCAVPGAAEERLGTKVVIGINADGSASWAASAPWRFEDDVRVGRVLGGQSEAPAGTRPLAARGPEKPRLLLYSNPVTTASRLDLWGREGAHVEVVFLDVGGRQLRSLRVQLSGGRTSLPFWESEVDLPQIGWVSFGRGKERVSTRWTRR